MYYGYTLISSRDDMYVFKNHTLNKTLKYYTNVYFPHDCPDALRADMTNFDILMLCGFLPDKVIYTYLVNLEVIVVTNMWFLTKYNIMYIECDLDDPCYPEPIDESHLESYTTDDVRYEHFITENNVNFLSMKQLKS